MAIKKGTAFAIPFIWASLVNTQTFVREIQKINLELLRETFKILAA